MLRPLLSFALALGACVAAPPSAAQPQARRAETAVASADRPKNVVLLIGDGFGPAYATMARVAAGRPLALDAILAGTVSTAATSSEVTDSAAGATAFSCGIKTYNGAIGVDATGAPCLTVLEAAEAAGLATGLVTTTRLTHATPAAFAAHVAGRDEEAEIAVQLLAAGVDVLFGGGLRFFTPEAAYGSRSDGRDLTREALERGYAVATDRAGWDGLQTTPALALLAPDHLAYELDRDETDEPSLAELTRRALDLLSAADDGRERGFFLMLEGGRIDHAGHANDPAAALGDVLAFDAAVAEVLDFARRDTQTLVIATADHETGGLALGRDGVYAWLPAALRAARQSAERMAARVAADEDVASVLRTGAAVDSLAEAEQAAFDAALGSGLPLGRVFAEVVSRRAGVGWTSGGHTAVDVNLYSFGPGAERFRTQMPNDALGRALFEALGLEGGAWEAARGQ